MSDLLLLIGTLLLATFMGFTLSACEAQELLHNTRAGKPPKENSYNLMMWVIGSVTWPGMAITLAITLPFNGAWALAAVALGTVAAGGAYVYLKPITYVLPGFQGNGAWQAFWAVTAITLAGAQFSVPVLGEAMLLAITLIALFCALFFEVIAHCCVRVTEAQDGTTYPF